MPSRIKNVWLYIIHSNQTGYVKDRYVGETVKSIFDTMDFTEIENIPGLMIFIYFHKAFDTLEWSSLFNCLDSFNFGHEFPLSPYLFLLAVETLAIAIWENEEIKGTVIDKQETKWLPHADDTTAVLSDTESGYKLFQLVNKF